MKTRLNCYYVTARLDWLFWWLLLLLVTFVIFGDFCYFLWLLLLFVTFVTFCDLCYFWWFCYFLWLLLLLVTFFTFGDFCYFWWLLLLLVTFVIFGDFSYFWCHLLFLVTFLTFGDFSLLGLDLGLGCVNSCPASPKLLLGLDLGLGCVNENKLHNNRYSWAIMQLFRWSSSWLFDLVLHIQKRQLNARSIWTWPASVEISAKVMLS